MLTFLPGPVLGVISLLLFIFNTFFWCTILYFFAILKLLIPHTGIRRQISNLLILIANIWISGNSLILRITQKIIWDVQGLENLTPKNSYLVISNHRSWTDIFVLQHIFKNRIPFLKFFLKQELIWVPFLGIAWWALDFPFLKRYSRHFLQKHPELRGKDMETTRKHCEKFKNSPVSIMNFLEGTRFNLKKHQKQNSPYRHLLLPRAGGVALVLATMGDRLAYVLDTTIIYPENRSAMKFWDLLSGHIPRITVRVDKLDVPENVAGKDYTEDQEFRERIQQWVNDIWQAKDHHIDTILAEYETSFTLA
jgi:1-acyl-sn-glycerol-3-phosphate acyltransferase